MTEAFQQHPDSLEQQAAIDAFALPAAPADSIQSLLSPDAVDHIHFLTPEELDDLFEKRTAHYTHVIDQKFGEVERAGRKGAHSAVLLSSHGSSLAAKTHISQEGITPAMNEPESIRLMDLTARDQAMRNWLEQRGWLSGLDAAFYANELGTAIGTETLTGQGWLLATPKDSPISVYMLEQVVAAKAPVHGNHLSRSLVAIDWHKLRGKPVLKAPRPDTLFY